MNLRIVGRFKDAESAAEALAAIEALQARAAADDRAGTLWDSDAFTSDTAAELTKRRLFTLSVNDLQQFAYEASAKRVNDEVQVATDDVDIQGLIKILIAKGAHVEIFDDSDTAAEGD